MCLRLAISGTTPPKRAWKSIWVATTEEHTLPRSSMTAMAVSSQEDSTARMRAPASSIFSRVASVRSPQAMGQGRMEALGSGRSPRRAASAAKGSVARMITASAPGP